MAQKGENSYNISNIFLKVNQLLWRKSFMQRVRALFYYIDAVLLCFCKKNKTEVTSDKKKVLVVYNLALGDGIMFYEVSKSIRNIYPRDTYEVSITCQKAFQKLYTDSGLYDEVIPMDFSGAVLNLGKRKAMFEQLRSKEYDIVLDPVGCEDCTTNVYVTRAIRAKEKIGVLDTTLPVHQMSEHRRNKIYSSVISVSEEKIHLISYYARFFQQLGDETCVARTAQLPKQELEFTLPEKFFIVFPVASMDVKKWDLKNYAYITEQISKKTGMPLVICGTNHDRPSIEEMLSYVHDVEVIDVIGKTDILQFAEVIGRAQLVVTNDTSAYHIAVAQRVLTFMICGGYTFNRYANYKEEACGCKEPVLITHKMECYDCNNHCKHQDFKVFPCIEQIGRDDAWEQISHRIESEGMVSDR